MGNNSCCVREKQSQMDNQNACENPHEEKHRYSLKQYQILEKLSHFNPRKNALPVALTHFLQDGCQGLMRSLPRLIEISEIYAPKGDQAHYFNKQSLLQKFNLTEYVSPGKQFYLDRLSEVFQMELKYFFQNNIINENSKSWGVILIMKIGKRTHSFTIKKRDGWEYVIHTLYEVTDEELKEEQEQIKKQSDVQKVKQKNNLYNSQSENKQQTQQNIDKLNYLLYSEESTLQDEVITPTSQSINKYNQKNVSFAYSPTDSASIINSSQKDYSQENNTCNKIEDQSQMKEIKLNRKSLNPVKRYSEIQRQSTRATYNQVNDLRLRDMVFKGYNCGELCFSPYEVFLEYLNSITEEYQQPATNTSQFNSENNTQKPKGFMQLITFKKHLSLDINKNLMEYNDEDNDYENILSPL